MSQDIVRYGQEDLLPSPQEAPSPKASIDLYGALLADARSENTRLARVYDIQTLLRYLNAPTPSEAIALIFSGTVGQANALALGYREYLREKRKSPSTVNRRLNTLRRVAKLARRYGVVEWYLEVDGLYQETFRDTRGPGNEGWRKLLAIATSRAKSGTTRGIRDLPIVRLLHDNGLRRAEVIRLELADIDVLAKRVYVLGKRKTQHVWITINQPTAKALEVWLERRGLQEGPAFVRLTRLEGIKRDIEGKLFRLHGETIWRIVRELGKAARLDRPVWPYGLRHAGATRLLDLTDGDVRAVHAGPDTRTFRPCSNTTTTARILLGCSLRGSAMTFERSTQEEA